MAGFGINVVQRINATVKHSHADLNTPCGAVDRY
jgi:hypothetical protein